MTYRTKIQCHYQQSIEECLESVVNRANKFSRHYTVQKYATRVDIDPGMTYPEASEAYWKQYKADREYLEGVSTEALSHAEAFVVTTSAK